MCSFGSKPLVQSIREAVIVDCHCIERRSNIKAFMNGRNLQADSKELLTLHRHKRLALSRIIIIAEDRQEN